MAIPLKYNLRNLLVRRVHSISLTTLASGKPRADSATRSISSSSCCSPRTSAFVESPRAFSVAASTAAF